MQAQREQLLNQLSRNGWSVAKFEENLEWWADEMWLIESDWSPVGSRAYITFLVDPQFEGNKRKGEQVWSIMASIAKPLDRVNTANGFVLDIGQGWKSRLTELIRHLSALRKEHLYNTYSKS